MSRRACAVAGGPRGLVQPLVGPGEAAVQVERLNVAVAVQTAEEEGGGEGSTGLSDVTSYSPPPGFVRVATLVRNRYV